MLSAVDARGAESWSSLQVSIREGHSVHADDVVLATATPIHHNLTVHSRQNPYRTFMIALTIPKVFTRSSPTCMPAPELFCPPNNAPLMRARLCCVAGQRQEGAFLEYRAALPPLPDKGPPRAWHRPHRWWERPANGQEARRVRGRGLTRHSPLCCLFISRRLQPACADAHFCKWECMVAVVGHAGWCPSICRCVLLQLLTRTCMAAHAG